MPFSNHLLLYFLILLFLPVCAAGQSSQTLADPLESTLEIDSLSVDPVTNFVLISWSLSTSEEVGSFEIHRQMPIPEASAAVIATPASDQFTYTDNTVTDGQNYWYYLVALSPQGSTIATSLVHGTIFLKQGIAHVCNKEIALGWDNYVITTSSGNQAMLPVPYDEIIILASYNDAPFLPVASMAHDQVLSQNFTFEEAPAGNYRFKVRARVGNTGLTSTSNVFSVDLTTLIPPAFSYIRAVDILDEQVQVRVHCDDQVVMPAYVLFRSVNSQIGPVPLDTIASLESTVVFTDHDVDPGKHQYFYKVEVLDSCGNSAAESQNISSSLFLQVQQENLTTNLLNWQFQSGWETGVSHYQVERKLPHENDFAIIQAFAGGMENSYRDDVSTVGAMVPGEIHYRLIAWQQKDSYFNFEEKVYSNVVYIVNQEVIFVPNAFRPESQIPGNNVFKPSMALVDVVSYQLSVFNRWGQQIFTTDDPHTAWNGKDNGRDSAAGVYAWVLRYRDANGQVNEKRGVVKLIR